jgi:hypothetical protein
LKVLIGTTDIMALTAVIPEFMAVNEGTGPTPEEANPIAVLLQVQV